jgi:hypothetical protein
MTKLNLRKIVSISVFLTFAFYALSQKVPDIKFWKYSIISVIIFFILYLLNLLYENFFWNKHIILKKPFLWLGFQDYPNITGDWEMSYYSSYKYDWDGSEYKTKGIGTIKIKKIEGGFSYSGNFNDSSFKSSNNFFEKNKNNKTEWVLGYKYTSKPQETDLANTGFVEHCGFVILNYDKEDINEIQGFYGNDENRKTRGKLILKKIYN